MSRISDAVAEYGAAYREQFALRAGRCEVQDEETAPCFLTPAEEQCEACAQRLKWNVARRFAGVKLRRLRRLLLKEVSK